MIPNARFAELLTDIEPSSDYYIECVGGASRFAIAFCRIAIPHSRRSGSHLIVRSRTSISAIGRSRAAFDDLTNFARQRLGIPLGRDALADILQQSAGQAIGPRVAFPLHVRSDRNEVDETAFELDASDFSGGAVPFPPAARWDEELVAPLDRTAQWLRSRNIGRIALSGLVSSHHRLCRWTELPFRNRLRDRNSNTGWRLADRRSDTLRRNLPGLGSARCARSAQWTLGCVCRCPSRSRR